MAPDEAYRKLGALFNGSMIGRTLYVVPYLMGPIGSPLSRVGVELTDSIYVAVSMGLMARMGATALAQLGDSGDFNRGLHSLGDLSPERRYICHFPQDNTIWSIGSGYGGNALLGKKSLSLRLGSAIARREGWMAEHMLILGVQSPRGEITYIAGAFPSASGKTNLAMLVPPSQYGGWRIWTVGDDIAWMRPGSDGRLWAVNPEAGYFGVLPGTSWKSNPTAMRIVSRDTLYTNAALAPDGTVWWEGKDNPRPAELVDWRGLPYDPSSLETAAQPNSRFTSPMRNNPMLSSEVDDPEGVPISAILFGGRRSDTVPLVLEAFDWAHGVYLGATLASETTAAAAGRVGLLRRDPMAMLPFCGYDMGEYFGHWLRMRRLISAPPRIFMVNWFRRSREGRMLWPGFGENLRVLEWIVNRVAGRVAAEETSVGLIPRLQDLTMKGLRLDEEQMSEAIRVQPEEWIREIALQEPLYRQLSRTMPEELVNQRLAMQARLEGRPEARAGSDQEAPRR
jgi:phosphoenolpyruvate carboxykinase (GTP)